MSRVGALSRTIRTTGTVFQAVILVVFVLQNVPISGQETIMAPPTVSVFAPVNDSDRSQYDTLSLTMADTITFTLRLLGDYRVQPSPGGLVSTVGVGDSAAATSYAEENDLDYLIVGSLGSSDSGEIAFEVAVWDHAAGAFTIREQAVAETLFDTFDVADALTRKIVSAMSGREIAFGTVRLDVPAGVGSYLVFIDGQYAGFGQDRLENVPAGERQIAIVPLAPGETGGKRYGKTVSLLPDEVTAVRLELPQVDRPWFSPELVAYESAEPERAATDSADRPAEAEIPDWFAPRFADGFNPDTYIFQNATVTEILGEQWFHTPARWQSSAARFPLAEWDMDGWLDEWPRSVPYFPFDPRSDGDAWVRVLEYQVAYGPEHIYLSVLLGGDWIRFLAGSPHIYLETTLDGPGAPARWNFEVKRQSGRWLMQARENRDPYEDYPFRLLKGVQIGQAEARLEIRIPTERFGGGAYSMEITEIWIEEEEPYGSGNWTVVYESGAPLAPVYGRRPGQ